MLIHNATLLTFDDANRVLTGGAVCYKDDMIVAVGSTAWTCWPAILTRPAGTRRGWC